MCTGARWLQSGVGAGWAQIRSRVCVGTSHVAHERKLGNVPVPRSRRVERRAGQVTVLVLTRIWHALAAVTQAARPYDGEVDHVCQPDETGAGDGSFSSSSPSSQSFSMLTESGEETGFMATLRDRFGDEVAERVQRMQQMHGQPRRLTEDELARLHETLAPLLRDIEMTGAIPLAIQEETYAGFDDDFVSVWAWHSDATGQGVFVPSERLSAERVARLAEQLQEWEIEELAAVGRSATWPECPNHPNSHPLEPMVSEENTAIWRCPRDGQVICAIGSLRS